MKLIEKLAREAIDTPWDGRRWIIDTAAIRELELRAYEAGFRRAREMAARLISPPQQVYYHPRNKQIAYAIEQLGEEDVGEAWERFIWKKK